MIEAPIVWGLMLGLGSSLHCAGMCGPIGCSLLMLPSQRRSDLVLRVAALQVGRIMSYALLGALVGLFGAGMQASMDFTSAHAVMQWTAALVVLWMGLSTAGMIPSLAFADRVLGPVARVVATSRARLSGAGPEVALIGGIIWGITPCAMVYAALLNSMLTGSVADGVSLMLAFGFATSPAVLLASVALLKASTRRRRPGRVAAGMMMIGAGILALLLTVPGSPLCITG